jgi:hypothetical protein
LVIYNLIDLLLYLLYNIYNKYNNGGDDKVYLKIDFEIEMPIYTQLRNQIVEGIALGLVKDGEELPSGRWQRISE